MSFDEMEIAPDLKVSDWKALALDSHSGDWEKAIHTFKSRLESRFIEPADILIAAHKNDSTKKVGFAVLALDFIVIETLQAFIEGELSRSDPSGLCKRFFTSSNTFKDVIRTEGFAGCLYGAYRCGISHQGQTDGDFRVRADGDLIQKRGDGPKYDITINRTKFHEAVKNAFEKYCDNLRSPDKSELRDNFIKKMNAICGIPS